MTFSAGTFAPNPRRAPIATMVRAQALIEAKLFLRHGEQQLLSLIIPIALLVGLTLVPVLDSPDPVRQVFPFTLAVAGMSAGFTGQAIAVAFDRRYGALKRIGASGVPSWTIIAGKIVAVLSVAVLQALILTVVALFLGWSAPAGALLGGVIILLLGVITFTALGLLLGGTMSSEVVLAVANLLWFVLLGAAAFAEFRLSGELPLLLNLVPSVAFSHAMSMVLDGIVPWKDILILLGWAGVSATTAVRFFRFTA